ncbi:microtubule binding protein [Aureococcus anophagefferens]|uniref:Microtubule binding protein n=1 Tax=Aureococcus anophagefferens TaxID=44056 RepID=A0ABR1GAG2_AURAN
MGASSAKPQPPFDDEARPRRSGVAARHHATRPQQRKTSSPREGNNWVFVLIFVVVCAIAFAVRAAAAPDAAPPQTTTTTTAYHGSRVRLPDGAQTITLKPEARGRPGASSRNRRGTRPRSSSASSCPRARRNRRSKRRRRRRSRSRPSSSPCRRPKRSRPLVPAARKDGDALQRGGLAHGLRRPCGLDVDPAVMKGTCCAFREPLPENAWTAPLNVPNETTRKTVAARPLWGLKHNPANDVVVGLAFGYAVDSYKMPTPSCRSRRAGPRGPREGPLRFEEDGLKTTGTCKWNKGWLRCFEAAKWHTPETWTQPVRCSGSTLGSSRDAMLKYADAMLSASDEWLCHRTKGIPSDQGYHNYLILSGAHARNGLRVLLGPLDTKWKVRDPVKGFITNTDGSRSPVVHQWDRWAGEMKTFLTKAFVTDSFVPGKGELYARPFEFVAYDPKTCADHPFRRARTPPASPPLRPAPAYRHEYRSATPEERRPTPEPAAGGRRLQYTPSRYQRAPGTPPAPPGTPPAPPGTPPAPPSPPPARGADARPAWNSSADERRARASERRGEGRRRDAIFSRLLRGGDGAGGGAGWNDAEYEGGGLFGMPPKLKQKQKREGAAAAAAKAPRRPRQSLADRAGAARGPGRAAQQRRPDGERQRVELGARRRRGRGAARAKTCVLGGAARRPSPPRRRASATRRGTPRGPQSPPGRPGTPSARRAPAAPRREVDRPRPRPTRNAPLCVRRERQQRKRDADAIADREPETRRNLDKRTALRTLRHRAPAVAAFALPLSPSARRDDGDDGDKENPPCDAGARVVVRVRPLLPHEGRGECTMHADMVRLLHRPARFPVAARASGAPGDGRRRVHASGARPCVDAALDGGVAALFMFGQTGSGKTHTMTGFEARVGDAVFGAGSRAADLRYFEVRGKRALDLLRKEDLRRRDGDDDGALHFSPKPLALSDDVSGVAADSVVARPGSAAQFLELLERGRARRATAPTDVNGGSSRSHAVCRLDFPGGGSLTLIDCAGSERSKDSMYHDAQRRKESAEINQSLYALKQCIRASRLVARWRKRGGFDAQDHAPAPPPFRSSALTRVLREAFTAPSAHLAVVATVSPAATDAEHSIATLRTVCELAGTSKAADAASDDRGKVVPKLRTDPGVARPRDAPAAPPLPPYPKAWAPTRLAAFFAQKLGLRGAADKVLDVKLDGKAASRMSAPALASALKLDGDAAAKIVRGLRDECDKCDRLHEIAREKRRRANRGYQ